MSALRLGKRSKADMTLLFRPCDGGCRSAASGTVDLGRKSGSVQVLILGRPAGYLCEACARDWQRLWGEFGGVSPDRVEQSVSYRAAA